MAKGARHVFKSSVQINILLKFIGDNMSCQGVKGTYLNYILYVNKIALFTNGGAVKYILLDKSNLRTILSNVMQSIFRTSVKEISLLGIITQNASCIDG